MATKPQNFSTDHILTQLVAYFNALPANQRVIGPTAFPFYNIKVITGPNGQAVVVAGDAAKDVDASSYLGEATFVWVGPRHETNPQTASTSRFFEVSKFVNQTGSGGTTLTFRNDVVTYNGAAVPAAPPDVDLPQDGDYTYYLVMTDQFGDGWNSGTIVLTIGSTDYELAGPQTTTTTVSFGAFTGDQIQVGIGNPGEYPDEMIVQLYQVNHGAPITDSSKVTVRGDITSIPQSGKFINFSAPFTPSANGPWPFVSGFLAPAPVMYGNFGQSIAMTEDGQFLAVAGPGQDKTSTYDAGQVFIYQISGVASTLFQTLTRPQMRAQYGYSVDISTDGKYLAVSTGAASGDDAYVYIYGRSNQVDQFTQQAVITHTAYTANAPIVKFGRNNKLFVASGAGSPASGGTAQGVVKMYRRTDITTWNTTPDITWTSDTPTDFSLFGYALSVSQNGAQVAVVEYRYGGQSSMVSRIHHYNSTDDGATYTKSATIDPADTIRSIAMFAEGMGIVIGTDNLGARLYIDDDGVRAVWTETANWLSDNSYIGAALYDPIIVAVDKPTGNVITHTIDLDNNYAVSNSIITNMYGDGNQPISPVINVSGDRKLIVLGQGNASGQYIGQGNVQIGANQ